ncbi:cytochrome oxidase assembly protein ShyY1 [Modicisalibacter xianhensis]|uniref:SURF1-like protein n=2 Tax=Modicisalibacter xianhensis TaxID=442341 RepID=A0A1I3G2U9_9GAMM|nr:cytochrome oxidase assembly protein ShyY1 [Halomonas xianhensis]SFI17481.1 Cytochrome oxidase assembly protein ShyY1 [Halomonas xianhensis]
MVTFSSNKPAGGVKWYCLWWVLWSLVVVLGMGLGAWQWQRAEEKRIHLAALDSAPLLSMPQQSPPDGAQILLHGRFLPQETRFLDNRVRKGQVGVAVLTPLVDPQGRWWLIERGFVPTGPYRHDPDIPTPVGPVDVLGQWQVAGETAPLFGPNQEGRRLQRIELASWRDASRFAYAGWLHQAGGDGAFAAWWTPSVMPPERHMAYAVQWWLLAIAALAMMWFGRRHASPRLPWENSP